MVKLQTLGILSIIVVALSVPAYADKGQSAYNKGVKAQRQQNYEAAYGFYKEAHTLTPGNAKYMAAFLHMRFNVAQEHVHTGQILRSTGSLTEALAEFQRAIEIDTTSFIAQQELRRTADMLRRQELQRSAPKTETLLKPGEELAGSLDLRPLSKAPITLRMTANADVAYKTICKLAGLNVLIDPDYRPQKMTVELNDVTLAEALDMVRLQSKTFWRPVSANTIFVAADSAGKRKELEQNVMRTFYLRNLSTPAELTEAANVVRQMLDVSRVQLLQEQDALIIRATPDQMVLAERLLAEVDQPKSEVVIDITVMEVSRDKIRNIGTSVPTSFSMGYLPGTSAAAANNGSGGGYTVSIGSFAMSVPGGSFTALASDSNTKILQSPEIRALNDEKATLRIGDRVPIATGSFAAGTVGAGSISPLVSTQFQYLDVGVNIDITPHIHEHEVTLKMALEISSVTGEQNIGGITQPTIGQRRIEHECRLADGEVNLLGGILEDTETQSLSGYPWISKLPLLRYLFGQENKERTENEIVFAITPHIIRSIVVNEESARAISIGTGSSIELRRKEPAPAAATAQAAPQTQAPGGPGQLRPAAPAQPNPQTKPVAP
jgi:general secretion pathway protein D